MSNYTASTSIFTLWLDLRWLNRVAGSFFRGATMGRGTGMLIEMDYKRHYADPIWAERAKPFKITYNSQDTHYAWRCFNLPPFKL